MSPFPHYNIGNVGVILRWELYLLNYILTIFLPFHNIMFVKGHS